MSKPTLDAAEAARLTLSHAEAMGRAARRLVNTSDALERAAAAFARGLLDETPPDGATLLPAFGAAQEATLATLAALEGLIDGLESLRFPFQDEAAPHPRLRARALDELRARLEWRAARAGEPGPARAPEIAP